MIKNIIARIGYAEAQSLSVLCYSLDYYKNSKGFSTKKEALVSLAKDLWAYYSMVVNKESEEDNPVPDDGSRAEEFEEWLGGLASEVNDSFGYPEQFDIKHKFVWSSTEEFSFPKEKESVLIPHSADAVITFALYKEGILKFSEDFDPKGYWIAKFYEEIIA